MFIPEPAFLEWKSVNNTSYVRFSVGKADSYRLTASIIAMMDK